MVIIPKQLQDESFRFVLLRPKSKIPKEVNWQTINNYKYDDPKLISHLNCGGNYGVLLGAGGLVVLDIDNPKIVETIKTKFNHIPTLKSLSGGKKLPHYWFKVGDTFKKYPIRDDGGETLFDVLCGEFYFGLAS